MCFHIHKKHLTKKIAIKDIICYKKFSIDYENHRRIVGIYRAEFLWWDIRRKSNTVHKKTILDTPTYNGRLYSGFHSYSNKKALHDYNCGITYECIIPKGAEYYYNPMWQEYISNELIVQLDKPI